MHPGMLRRGSRPDASLHNVSRQAMSDDSITDMHQSAPRRLCHNLLVQGRTDHDTRRAPVPRIFLSCELVNLQPNRVDMLFFVPILTSFGKALIQICTYDTLIELRTPNVFHAVECILVSIVLNKAETAWCLLIPIQTHDQALNLTASVERNQQYALCQTQGHPHFAKSSWICSSVV